MIVDRWEGPIGVIVSAAMMALLLVFRPQRSAGVSHPVLLLVVLELTMFTALCACVVSTVRPPRVELDEWGFRTFDPFFGSQERAWDDCGEFRVRLLGREGGCVYMTGPGFNQDLPVWRSRSLQLPIVARRHRGMTGQRFAALLKSYRDAYGTALPKRPGPGGVPGPVTRNWLDLDVPSPDL